MGNQPLRNPLWEQLQKVRVTADGGVRAPVKASAEDGVVVGDPPFGGAAATPATPAAAPAEPARRGRLRRLLGRRR